MKNKLTSILVFALILSVFLTGCGNTVQKETSDNEETPVVSENVDDKETSAEVDEKQSEKAKETKTVNKDTKEKISTNQEKTENKSTVDTKKESTTVSTTNKSQKTKTSSTVSNGTKTPKNKESGNDAYDNETKSDTPDDENANKKSDEGITIEDKMNWPDNEYTKLVPKPSRGVVRKADKQNGIYCILMTGADLIDAKTYAANLINCGYTSNVTETIETETYLFGGGNSAGTFVVVSYQKGQFIIGIEQ